MNWITRMCMLLVPVLLVAAADPLDRKWDLESLQPDDPGTYFELAEEVADAASSEPERTLAVRLYALAATLDEARWGRSSLLGIIDLLDDETRVRGLRALLEFYEEEQPQLLPSTRLVMGAGDRVTVSAVDVLSLYRSGMAAGARQRLGTTGVRDRLLEYEDEIPGGMNRLLDEITTRRDKENRRRLAESEIVAQLQVQSRLLGGREESWSATLSAWGGRPLPSIESHDLGTILNLDLARSVWRNGRWRVPVDARTGEPGDQ